MNSNDPYYPPPQGGDGPEDSGDGGFQQQVKHSQISARIPEAIGAGVYASGVIVQQGRQEFILDFIVTTARPHQVVARVVLPHEVIEPTINAMRQNIEKYESRFDAIPALPVPPKPANPPRIEDIYDQLKLPDNMLSGCYANGALISHSATEFVMDFIASFFPRSSVSCRVFMAVPQMPRTIDSLQRALSQFRQRQSGSSPDAPPSSPPADQDETPPSEPEDGTAE